MPYVQGKWRSDDVPLAERTDAWQYILNENYGDWHTRLELPEAFSAEVRSSAIGGVKLVHMSCGGSFSKRTRDRGRRQDDHLVGVQLTTAGNAIYRTGGRGVTAGAGTLLLWTTEAEIEMDITEDGLRTVSLMVPWSLIKHRFPDRKQLPRCKLLNTLEGIGAFLATHLSILSGQIHALNRPAAGAVKSATLELLNAAMGDAEPPPGFGSQAMTRARVQEFILQHLHVDDLTPAKVAAANQISVRYLHLLFADTGTSVGEYMLGKRLEACQRALTDPACRQLHISEIAFRWGFQSVSHFCRTFKRRFGMTPGEARDGPPI
nr:helix-turn-helix domain-containing protein [uncultured Duganella sp.]